MTITKRNPTAIRECKYHGLTEYVLENSDHWRCKKCRSMHIANRRRKVKSMAVAYKGGKCENCGYDKCVGALDFHHKDNNKEFAISRKGHTRSWERVRQEIEKCTLLCANCHRETHYTESNEVLSSLQSH